MKKYFLLVVIVLISLLFVGCSDYLNNTDTERIISVAKNFEQTQPTPTDISYSLERYNLIRRAYWVNGQRERANTLVCEIEKPLGYIVLLSDNGAIVGKFIVDGKVSSLNSYLIPLSEYYEQDMAYYKDSQGFLSSVDKNSNKWLADVDGAYGENDDGIFFFTNDGKYVEWSGQYLYSDIPFVVDNPVITYMEVQ